MRLLLLLLPFGLFANVEYHAPLQKCSTTVEIVLDNFFMGKGLDKNCLEKEFNEYQNTRELKLLTQRYSTEFGVYQPDTYFKQDISQETTKVATVTSLTGLRCGESCVPSLDYMHEYGDSFWYLVPYTSSDINIIYSANVEAQLIYLKQYEPTRSINSIIHIPLKKEFQLGSGSSEFKNVNLESITTATKGRKSYFIEGGAFWYDTESTFNFATEESSSTFVNSGSACYKTKDFIEMTGFNVEFFGNRDEVCVQQYD